MGEGIVKTINYLPKYYISANEPVFFVVLWALHLQ